MAGPPGKCFPQNVTFPNSESQSNHFSPQAAVFENFVTPKQKWEGDTMLYKLERTKQRWVTARLFVP